MTLLTQEKLKLLPLCVFKQMGKFYACALYIFVNVFKNKDAVDLEYIILYINLPMSFRDLLVYLTKKCTIIVTI